MNMRKVVYIPPEQIVGVLREAEALMSAGKTVKETVRLLGISERSYYLWRQEFGVQVQPANDPEHVSAASPSLAT